MSSRRAYPFEERSQTQEAGEPSSGAGFILFTDGMSVLPNAVAGYGVLCLKGPIKNRGGLLRRHGGAEPGPSAGPEEAAAGEAMAGEGELSVVGEERSEVR